MAVDQTRARLIVKTRFMVQLGASRAREAVASRKTDYGGTVSVGGSKVSITGGVLYVVATPLGHLGDMTPRAITVLQGVDVIAAEDTRHSAPLLRHFDIATPTIALHEHTEREQSGRLVARLRAGEAVALISDAGARAHQVLRDRARRAARRARRGGAGRHRSANGRERGAGARCGGAAVGRVGRGGAARAAPVVGGVAAQTGRGAGRGDQRRATQSAL